MSTVTASPEPLIGRCFTKARKHALVVGHWPGGGRIWGGPYTVPQIIVAAATFAAAFLTRGLWAHHGLVDVLPLIGVPYALALVVGRIHSRNPLSVAASALVLAASGSAGRLDGRPVRQRRSGALVGVCTLTWQPPNEPGRAAAPLAEALSLAKPGRLAPAPTVPENRSAADRPAADVPVVRVASGVGALLAARAASTTNTNEQGQ
ncbi:hypothetical protein EYS09_11935 [Streptomyces kasugaensis]|uniref:Uncharacterized protein n=1 Tax=Streptomyces kasugaensis TaxID=1946 RepID=A0A4Q9HWU6_STRKA|nr:hypothetical protein [Streptomyces kasugaensis]TBO59455.1 hypothetical protein EYS09_11935 [Streptomyces kasugaensis]